MHGDIRTSQPTSRQRPSKKKDIPLFRRQRHRAERRLYTATLAHLPKKIEFRLVAIRRKIMKRALYSKCCYHRRNCSSKKYTEKIFSHRKSMKIILKRFNYFFIYLRIILQLIFFLTKIELVIYFYNIHKEKEQRYI